ncbi:hypothetical protein NQK81_17850 [Amycolatopsis roodepoortensis]|uniref:hypothetical protein n=1 Tax=Amycolatopsis roodepoortensis TaxID=700274 RepID=UPI00214BE85B|nr:hypothetical protein [Amycolatopsis roodepoortensis]UUV35223.1 hypothetical protein NQK81_17850 [Amycolatopsis roodepoortensis]
MVILDESQQLQLTRMKLRSRIKAQTAGVALALLGATWGGWFFLSQDFFLERSGAVPELMSRRKAEWPRLSESASLIAILVTFVVLAGLVWWATLRIRRAEQRLARSVPRRIAHGKRLGVREVAGTGTVTLWLVSSVGGIGLGLTIGFLAESAENQLVGFTYAGGIAVLGVLSVALARQVIRQPSLAVDELSLRTDDMLRKKDAQLPLVPAGVLLAIPLASAIQEFATWLWVYVLGSLAISLLATLVVRLHRAPLDSPPPGNAVF